MRDNAASDSDQASALDLARHRAKYRLLSEVLAMNRLGIRPTKAQVCRSINPDLLSATYTRTRWYALMARLINVGYLESAPTMAGHSLTVTKDGRDALRAAGRPR